MSALDSRIPCVLMRGGTSRAPIFMRGDLPEAPGLRDQVLLAVMGSPAFNRIDGIGGMSPVTSKLAIVSRSERDDADVDYLFGQVDPKEGRIDYSANCGNVLAAVAPFAIERGLVIAETGETIVRIFNLNTEVVVHTIVQTPEGQVSYEGSVAIDGAPGTGAPIAINFIDAVGAVTGKLLPTGSPTDIISGLEVSCVDVAVPMVILASSDLGLDGSETPGELNQRPGLLSRLEAIRLQAAIRMGLGDRSGSVVPKLCLVSRSKEGGDISSRYFTPTQCHPSHAVTGALCLGVASLLPGTVASRIRQERDFTLPGGMLGGPFVIEHPSGRIETDIRLGADLQGTCAVSRAAFVRTASKLFEGFAFVPRGRISE